MARKYESRVPGHKVDIPFTQEESNRFKGFLESTGRKAGPWMRILAIKAMDAAERIGDGSGQARELAEAMAGSADQSDANEARR